MGGITFLPAQGIDVCFYNILDKVLDWSLWFLAIFQMVEMEAQGNLSDLLNFGILIFKIYIDSAWRNDGLHISFSWYDQFFEYPQCRLL